MTNVEMVRTIYRNIRCRFPIGGHLWPKKDEK